MKTNYKDFAKRYELAEREVWAQTDKSRQQIIIDAKRKGDEKDGTLIAFTQKVIKLAENEDHKFSTKHPPVPAHKLLPIPIGSGSAETEILRINC